jgi:hypothetical protein
MQASEKPCRPLNSGLVLPLVQRPVLLHLQTISQLADEHIGDWMASLHLFLLSLKMLTPTIGS